MTTEKDGWISVPCEKCGSHGHFKAQYHATKPAVTLLGLQLMPAVDEHFEVHCMVCGYTFRDVPGHVRFIARDNAT